MYTFWQALMHGLTADRSTVIHSLGRPDLLRNSEVILMKLKTSENFFGLQSSSFRNFAKLIPDMSFRAQSKVS